MRRPSRSGASRFDDVRLGDQRVAREDRVGVLAVVHPDLAMAFSAQSSLASPSTVDSTTPPYTMRLPPM
jgi:hypothetical protein